MPERTLKLGSRLILLDARPDRLDLRDLPYRPPVTSLPQRWPDDAAVAKLLPAYREAGLVLDQKKDGACTGFGLAAVVNFLRWRASGFTLDASQRVSPWMFYQLARFYDEWPGERYEGSSARGALKGWHRHGVCLETLWGARGRRPNSKWAEDAVTRPLGVYYRVDRQSVVDLQAAIAQAGAVYVAANVHAGWHLKPRKGSARVSHASLPAITRQPGMGGHAFALVGYNENGFVVQNSWGEDWGAGGFALLPYEDWADNGLDAWVAGLGVPLAIGGANGGRGTPAKSRQFFVASRSGGSGLLSSSNDAQATAANTWSEEAAYWHTLVTGNDGTVLRRLPQVADGADNARFVAYEQPLARFKAQAKGSPRRLVVYAHGGLNSEADSIKRIRSLGPAFDDNGLHPLFVTWKSGWAEVIGQMLADGFRKNFPGEDEPARGLGDRIVDATDRALEALCRQLLVRAMWSEMKENVARAEYDGQGLDALATQIAALAKDAGKGFELHLVGHSAGSFVCGRLLSELAKHSVSAASCTLYAPACDLDFALTHYKAAIDSGQLPAARFDIHALSDRRELDDSVGPYRKSLLYLVSRALERWHKTPLLGMASAFDPACNSGEYWHRDALASVTAWQAFWWGTTAPSGFADDPAKLADGRLHLLDAAQVSNGARQIATAHGCFDNSVDIVRATIERMTGSAATTPFGPLTG